MSPLIKVEPGDWLLLSEDQTVLWRLTRYRENGSSCDSLLCDSRGRPVGGSFWMLRSYRGTPERAAEAWDTLEEDQWDTWETLLPSRKAAIEAIPGAKR